MPQQPITVEIVDQIKPMIFDLATRYRKTLRGCRYADIRLEVEEGLFATAENGGSKHSSKDYGFAVGIRMKPVCIVGTGLPSTPLPSFLSVTVVGPDGHDPREAFPPRETPAGGPVTLPRIPPGGFIRP